jgi:hypothetical protein
VEVVPEETVLLVFLATLQHLASVAQVVFMT